MPENVNTSVLEIESALTSNASKSTMVKVDHVSMVFNMASEQLNSIKEYVIAAAKRELRFKEFRALDDVSFEVKQGDVFGILGTNGSGKSTILKIIAGVLEPSKGTCTVNGNIAPLIELGAGFDMELTARENIYLNGALLGYSKPFVEENFDDIVQFAEVEKFLDMPMKNYSSGMVARIAFAIATVIVPEILIVDEVLSVGDFMFQKKCEDRITKLIKEHGVTVLIVSHNNDQIERLCNKAVWIEKGHLRMAGTAQEVCRTYRVLGGHVGSKESEQIVFETLQDPKKPDMSGVESIEADTRYGIAAKLANKAFPEGAKSVVLASGEQSIIPLISNGLAGALNAPILLLRNDGVPDATAQELVRLNPSSVVVIDGGTIAIESVRRELERLIPALTIECLAGVDTKEAARKVYEYGLRQSLWGKGIALTYEGCLGDMVTFSPYAYKTKCPILLKDVEEALDRYTEEALTGSFENILVFAGPCCMPDAVLDSIREKGKSVVRFCGDGPYEANSLINNWIDERLERCGIVCSSICHPADSLAIGPYSAVKGLRVMLEDPQNLDSVAHAIEYVAEIKPGYLAFAGDRNRFSTEDQTIIAKVLQ